MGADLKYNLEQYNKQLENITKLKDEIDINKTNMKNNLEQLKKDWTLPGGVAFFDSVDGSWEEKIKNCITILEDLIAAMTDAYNEYGEIEGEAKKRLKF